jgi:hypothetical protein
MHWNSCTPAVVLQTCVGSAYGAPICVPLRFQKCDMSDLNGQLMALSPGAPDGGLFSHKKQLFQPKTFAASKTMDWHPE